jgi:hypothetical protein
MFLCCFGLLGVNVGCNLVEDCFDGVVGSGCGPPG